MERAGACDQRLDAYAAVSAAIGGTLPDSAERNDTPGTASPLVAMGPGVIGTGPAGGGFSSISRAQDVDYWSFNLPVLATVHLSLDWYERLARLNVGVVAVDDGGKAVPLTAGGSASSGGLILDGLLSPGRYAVRVAGGAPTLYRLRVRHRLAALGEDMFEPNDTFDTAVGLRFEAQKGSWKTPLLIRDFGPGSFDATLHLTRGPFNLPTVNPDYFRLDVPERTLLRIPTVWVDSVDAPVDVTLYDSNRDVIDSWHSKGEIVIQPPERTTCFLEVTGADQTRYTIRSGCVVEKGLRLGPLAEELRPIPKWRYSLRGSHESIEVRIELPAGSQLRGEAGVAGLRSSGTLGECRYRTGAGDIVVEHVAGAAELTTGTGDVRIDRIDSSATIKNSNGDTWVGEVVGDLQVKAANGKIAVEHAHAAVTAKTANGDVRLGEVSQGVVVAETACGRVDVAVRAGVAAWLDLHTGFGHVHNLLDASQQPAPSENTVEVRARSSFGDITVRRADVDDTATGAA